MYASVARKYVNDAAYSIRTEQFGPEITIQGLMAKGSASPECYVLNRIYESKD